MNTDYNTPFPKDLIEFYTQYQCKPKPDIDLVNFFEKHEPVRTAFAAWAKSHPLIVMHSSELRQAHRIANSKETLVDTAHSIGSLVPFSNTPSHTSTNALQTINYNHEDAQTALNLHILNIIDQKDFENLFFNGAEETNIDLAMASLVDKKGRNCFFNESIFRASLPSLKTQDLKTIYAILSFEDNEGNTPLHKPSILKMALELLEIFIPDLDRASSYNKDRSALFKLFSKKNKLGKNILRIHGAVKIATPILLKATDIVADLLSIQDDTGDTPLHFSDAFKDALPILDACPYYFRRLMSIKNNEGNTPVHLGKIFKLSLNYFPLMHRDDFNRLATTQNNEGKTPLHYVDIFELALPMLKKRNVDCIRIFSTQDNDGNTPLHYFQNLWLANKEIRDFNKIFDVIKNNKNRQGVTVDLMNQTLPTIAKFLFDVLKGQNPDLDIIFLNKHSLFQWANLNCFLEFLMIRDEYGCTYLHYTDSLKILVPILIKAFDQGLIPSSYIVNLFSKQNNSGKTPLHHTSNTRFCDGVIPLQYENDEFRDEDIWLPSEKTTLPIEKVQSAESYANNLKIAEPLLLKLDLNQLHKLLRIRRDDKKENVYQVTSLAGMSPSFLNKLLPNKLKKINA